MSATMVLRGAGAIVHAGDEVLLRRVNKISEARLVQCQRGVMLRNGCASPALRAAPSRLARGGGDGAREWASSHPFDDWRGSTFGMPGSARFAWQVCRW